MANHRFPQLGPDGYVSPYTDIDYSKGPKVIYGDTDVMRLILNDPQTDDDDEWGRTEQIALRQLTDEAITVRKALFGWSSVDGLLDKWDYFETNHFDIDYTTPADSTLTIGNTVLSDGQLNLGNTNFFNSSEFSMNGGNFFIEKTGDLAMRIVGGDNDGGAGDVVINMLPAPVVASNSAAAITFVINNQTYSFTGSTFALPTGTTIFADSATYSGNISGVNMTLSGTLTVGTTSTTIDTDSIVISDVATINSTGLILDGTFVSGVGLTSIVVLAGGPRIAAENPPGGNSVMSIRSDNIEFYSTRSSETVCSVVGAPGASAAVAWTAASYVVDTDSFNITWNTGVSGENLLIDFDGNIRLRFRRNAIESVLIWDADVYAYSWENIDNLGLNAVTTGYNIFLIPSAPRISMSGKARSGANNTTLAMDLGDTGIDDIHGLVLVPTVPTAQTDEGLCLIDYDFFVINSTSDTVFKTGVSTNIITFEFRTTNAALFSYVDNIGFVLSSTSGGERFRVGSLAKGVSIDIEDIVGLTLRDNATLSPLDIGIYFQSADFGSGIYGFAFTDQSISGDPSIIVEKMPFYVYEDSNNYAKISAADGTLELYDTGSPLIRLSTSNGISTEKGDYLKWTHFETTLTTAGSLPDTQTISVPSGSSITGTKILGVFVTLGLPSGSPTVLYTNGWTQVEYNALGSSIELIIPSGSGINTDTEYSVRVIILYKN